MAIVRTTHNELGAYWRTIMGPSARRVSPLAHSILTSLTSLSCSQHPQILPLFTTSPHCSSRRLPNAPLSLLRSAGLASCLSYLAILRRACDGGWSLSRSTDHTCQAGADMTLQVWVRVLIREIMRGCVSVFSSLLRAYRHAPHAPRLGGDAEVMRSIWQHDDALATDYDTGAASSAHMFTLFFATSCPKCRASAYPRATQCLVCILIIRTRSQRQWRLQQVRLSQTSSE